MSVGEELPGTGGPAGYAPRGAAASWLNRIRMRLHEQAFWVVQALVLGVAAVHWTAEATHFGEQVSLGGLEELPVVLHLVPVVYAGFRYGYEGSVLTGLWSGVLAIPNLVLWHSEGFRWVGDLSFIVFVMVLGAVIAVPVERERRQRERLRRYARAVTRAQERERARIARDLHDAVAQELVLLRRRLDDLEQQREGVGPEDLRERAGRVLDTIRRITRGLRPPVLEDLGLTAAVRSLGTEAASRTGIEVTVEAVGAERRLAGETELALYRVAQEALHNAERHGDPDEIAVTVAFRPGVVVLTVADDGRGFDPRDLEVDDGLGLLGMRERAELAGGNLRVRSRPGRGTIVEARFPDA